MLAGRTLFGSLVFAWAASAATPALAETIRVTVEKLEFSPADVNAKVGDTIEWVNEDVIAHTATVNGKWDVMIPSHKSGSLNLKQAGTFDYYCRFHPNMKGRVQVSPQ
jgi:plastocyanin